MRSNAYRGAAQRVALLIGALCAGAAMPTPAQSQQDSVAQPGNATVPACAPQELPNRTREELKQAADEAERRFRELLRADPRSVAARVGLAQVLIQCQLSHASPMAIMALVEEAEKELGTALAAEPAHWSGRFLLAMLLHNLPAMLGRGDDAVREFERLIAQQGARADDVRYALPYLHLGDRHLAAGRRQSAIDVWRRGLALFPSHPELVARLEAAGAAAEPDTSWLASSRDTAAARAAAPAQLIALAPLRAEASNHQFQATRSSTTLRRLDVYTMPGGTGEMLQALQALPGATRANDGAELYVRGGDPAETPVFFDGGRLAFPGRWESLYGSAMGVVDAAVLRRAYFSSGGFSARYGNALSGVVDVETEGRPAQSALRFGANMVQAGLTARAPIGDRTGGWGTISATDTRLVALMNGEADLFVRSPQSVQGIGGIAFEPRSGVELRATALSLGDRYTRHLRLNGHDGEFASGSTLQHVALSARALTVDGRRGVAASTTVSRRANGMTFGVLDRAREDVAFGARIEGDAVLFVATRVRTGAELMRYQATTSGRVPLSPALAPGSPSLLLAAAREDTWHAGAYLEAEHEPVAGLSVVTGLRADRLPGEHGVTLDPRVAAAYTAGDWTLRLGGGLYQQGSWRARYRLPDAGQPAGVARRASHLVAGIERGGELALRVEGYRKRYTDYAPLGEGPAIAAGTNAGVDAIARWSPRSGPRGWLSYSLLRGRLELEDGREVASSLDVTHSLTAVARVALGEAWEIGATARYATGRPFTPIVGAPSGEEPWPRFGAPNGARLPDHRRLDARVSRYAFGQGRMALVYLEMLNLLDRRNVMGYTYGDDYTTRVPVNSFFAYRTAVLGIELQFN
jgi:vitamin B12 transporter